MVEDIINNFLKTGPNWARMKISISGVFVLKLPAYKDGSARLAVELNPADSNGSPTKKRERILRSMQELEEFKILFQFEKLSILLGKVDTVNSQIKNEKKVKATELILEI